MIILGIDTATPQVGCALAGPDGPVASFQLAGGRRHAETLAPAIEFVCRQAGVALSRVDAVAVDVGPGLFTGLRVGLATAQALATGLGVPVVGLSSLGLLAEPVSRPGRLTAAVVDARRGEVFWALYRQGPDGPVPLTAAAVAPPAEVAAELAARGECTLAVGDGALRYVGLLRPLERVEVAGPALAFPLAATLARLARPLALRGEVVAPDRVAAVYLRGPDTRINWATRDRPPDGDGPGADGPAGAGERTVADGVPRH